MEIKPGTIAYLKTTEEPVFVLDVTETISNFPALSGTVVTVRRPVLGEGGFEHRVETFHVEELESLEAKRKQKLQDMASFKAHFDATEEEFPLPKLKN